jgi:hypothetical protein
MRNIFLLFFTVLFTNPDFAQKAMSFNGQDGRKPSARNMDKEELLKFWFEGALPTNLAYYDVCKNYYLHTGVAKKASQDILLEQLKAIQLLTGELSNHITTDSVRAYEQQYMTLEPWDESMGELTLISLYSDLSGKTGQVTRGKYFPGEMVIVFTSPLTGTKFVQGSAACANLTPPSAMPTNGGGRGGGFEEFDGPGRAYTKVDTLNSGKGVTVINNIHVEGAQINNSGNSTVTVPEAKTTSIRTWGEEESDDKPAPRGGGSAWSGGDYYYTPKQPVSISIGADPYNGAYFGLNSSRFNLDLRSGACWNWRPNQYYGNNWGGCNYNYNTCRPPTYHNPGPTPHNNGGFVPNGTGSPATPGNNGHFVPNGTGTRTYQGGGGGAGGSFNPNGGG